MEEKGIKEKILDSLDGNLIVTKVEKEFWDGGAGIVCEFNKKGNKGTFRYFWDIKGEGIDYVEDYVEDYGGEDIDCVEGEIFEWIDKHFQYKSSISLKYDGKELLK